MKLISMTTVVGLCCLGFTSMAFANDASKDWQTWPLGERFRLAIAYYKPKIDTEVTISEVGGIAPNNPIDIENNLGLDDKKGTFFAALDWRFAKKHRVNLRYFDIKRNASNVLDTEIEFDGTVYPINVEVSSELDIAIYELAYAYSVIFTPKMDFSVGLGISAQDFSFAIDNELIGREQSDFVAPLPTFNLGFNYALTKNWILEAGFGWLDVSFDVSGSDIDGRILRYDGGLRWKPTDRFSAAIGYSIFDLELDYLDDNDDASFEYKYSGPLFRLATYF